MVYINRGEISPKLRVPTPLGASYFANDGTPFVRHPTGLFGRSDVDLEAISSKLESTPADVAITDWQLWAQAGWKTAHGTAESAARFGKKLEEETAEFTAAASDFIDPTMPDRDRSREMLVSESGDVLWCALSGLSNANVVAADELQLYLYQLTMGTVLETERGIAPTPWDRVAGRLAIKKAAPVLVKDIEEFMRCGYIPQMSLAMNLSEEDLQEENPPYSVRDRTWELQFYAHTLHAMLLTQYGVMPGGETIGYDSFLGSSPVTGEIGPVFARIFFEVAYIAKALADIPLHEIIRHNYLKVSGRIAANLVDHEDGERPVELR